MWRELLRRPELTIVIPLHGGGRWVDVISDNIAMAPRHARIVISDQSHVDDALRVLRARHRADRRVQFVAGRSGPGWREHLNRLIAANTAPLFSVLPQDDSIASGYYESLVSALHDRPAAGLAFPRLRAIREGQADVEHGPPPFALGARPPWEEAIALLREWNLGVPWRGVVRRRHLRPLLATPNDAWADLIWVFGIAVEAHLVEVPEAVYRKRYHDDNTHHTWVPLPQEELLRLQRIEIERRLRRRPGERAAALAALEPKTAGDPGSQSHRSP